MPLEPQNCPRCHAPLPASGSEICAACSVGNLFGIESPPPSPIPAKPLDLLDDKYQLGDLIGEGGFGRVYLAQQSHPVKRKVAIKTLKEGTDPTRFEAEGQALASLDHPGIAKVFDSGIDDLGVPFLVMEFFPGEPITAKERSFEDKLQLFIKICEAVQHAHQRGIIHRDLKPSNILVNQESSFKVIDFGIAKATQHLLTEKTLLTGMHQFVGTPGYVSPEQAGMKGRDVDTRSDIYSLGALLHEMLTGAPPFGKQLQKATRFAEILHIIQEEEVQRPPGIPADLAWIILRALAKNPDDRYSSASELARDIQRFLNRQPIEARAPSQLYRIGKFVSRNKAASIALCGLIAGFILASYGLIRAREEAREAQVQAERASAVVSLINEMFSATDPALARDSDYTVRQLLDDHALSFAGKLDHQPAVELSLQRTLANAYQGLAEHKTAEAHFVRALALGQQLQHIDLPVLEYERARSLRLQGRYQDALTEAESATPSLKRDVLIVELHRLLGEKDQVHQLAKSLLNRVTDQQDLTILALTFAETGDYPTARKLADKALEVARQNFGDKSMHLIPPHQALADIASLEGNTELVTKHRKAALALARAHLQPNHPTSIYVETRAAEIAADQTKDDLKRLIARLLARAGAGENPETLKPLMDIGTRLFAEGKSGDAIDLLTEFLRVDYDHLSSGENIAFNMRGTLIGDVVRSGQIKNFIPLINEAHESARELFGNEGIHTVEIKRILAYMYRWDNRFPESLNLGREAFHLSRQNHGETHGVTINCLINLIETLWDLSRDEEVITLITSDLDGTRSATDTTVLIEKVADYYWQKQSRCFSETLYEQALENHRKSKSLNHPDCIRLLARLVALERSGRWFRKENRSQLFLAGYEASLESEGITSPNTTQLAAWLTAERGRFLRLPQTISFLKKQLALAQFANAPKKTLATYSSKLDRFKNTCAEHRDHFERLKMTTNPQQRLELVEHALVLGKVDDAKTHLDQFLPLAFQSEDTSLPLRKKILQAAFRLHWDRDETSHYWQEIDQITDSQWPLDQTEILIPRNARWFYREISVETRHDWMAKRHDFENTWLRGSAPFSDFRFPKNHRLSYRPSDRFPSTRFRHQFECPSSAKYQKTKIRITYPAGFILYLNGEEVLRKHLATDATATSYGQRRGLDRPLESEVFELPISAFKAGSNTLAIQVHRRSDRAGLYFDLQLEALKK